MCTHMYTLHVLLEHHNLVHPYKEAWGVVQVGTFPLHPFLPMVHWDGMDSGNTGMGGGTGWDVPTSSLPSHGTLGWDGQWGYRHGGWYRLGCSHFVPSFPWYIGMGWTVGIQAWGVVQVGMFPLRPFLPMVHWDGMDSGDTGMGGGTGWDVPTSSLPSHGTLGWDGQWGYRHGGWNVPTSSLPSYGTLGWDGQWGYRHGGWYRLGCSHFVPSFQWYIGMGWTVGIQAWRVVQVGMFPLRPFLPMVHWDGMDSGNTGMGSGTGWDVPMSSLPSHGRDGRLGWDMR